MYDQNDKKNINIFELFESKKKKTNTCSLSLLLTIKSAKTNAKRVFFNIYSLSASCDIIVSVLLTCWNVCLGAINPQLLYTTYGASLTADLNALHFDIGCFIEEGIRKTQTVIEII